MSTTKIVFMGSPDFAIPSLKALAEEYPIAGVVTQPDRPAGRGRRLVAPPVKELANELDLPVIQPSRLRDPEPMAQLRAWQPELIVVAAFGQILRSNVLDLPPHGCINVHASLLPRWRGAAPVRAAILHGDEKTGVTIMQMDEGVDTGPILSQRAMPIQPGETPLTLTPKLAQLGADLLMETLPSYLNGELQPQPQADSQATYAPMLKKEDGRLDFNQPALELARRVRAFQTWPGSFMQWDEKRLKVLRAHAATVAHAVDPGRTTVHGGQPAVGTTEGLLVLDEVQPAGKRAMAGGVFLNGAKGWGDKR